MLPVYQGPIAGAVVLPRGPVAGFSLQPLVDRKNAQDKARADQSKSNASALQKDLEFSPKAEIADYNTHLADRVKNEYYEKATQIYKGDRSPSSEELADLAKTKLSIQTDANTVKAFNDQIKTIYQVAKENKGGELNSSYILEKLGGVVRDEKGNLRPPSELRNSDPASILNDPNAYNWSSIDKNISDTIAESINEEVVVQNVGGLQTLQEIETKSKFAELDSSQRVLYDENGMPKLKITPETLSRYLKHDGAKKVIDAEVLRLGEKFPKIEFTRLDALASLKKGDAVIERKIKSSRVPNNQGSSKKQLTPESFEIVPSEGVSITNYSKAKESGVAGVQGIEMHLPNFAKNIQIDEYSVGDVQSFRVNGKGIPEIVMTKGDRGKDNVETMSIPYNKSNLAKIGNSLTSPEKKALFDGVVNKFNSALKNNKPLEVDDDKLNQVSGSVRATISDLDNKDITDQEAVERIKVLLSENGIKDVKISANGRIIPKGMTGSSEITIDGEEFSSKDLKSINEKIKKLIFDKAGKNFVRPKVEFDANDPL